MKNLKNKNIFLKKNFICMKKVYFYILIFFLFVLNFSFTYSDENLTLKTKEDIEIAKIENDIANLKDKIIYLKQLKENKNSKNLKVALVLSGGGAKGYAHLGVLKILERENIKIDYITGTSIGALVGSMYSAGYSLNEIEENLDKLNLDNFLESGTNVSDLSIDKKRSLKKYSFSLKYNKNFNFSLPKGLKDTEFLYLELKKIFKKYKNIEDLPTPIKIIATNLNNGKTVAFEKGDLAKFLTASMAVPAILEPVKIDGVPYVDGLITRNLPVEDAYDMGADIVIASDIGAEILAKENYNLFSILNQIVTIHSATMSESSRKKASILISPNLSTVSAIDTLKKEEIIKLGEKAAEKQIMQLKTLPKKTNKNLKNYITPDTQLIKEIKFSNSFNKNIQDSLYEIFYDFIGKEVSNHNIEKRILRAYNLKYVNKLYYEIKGNTLYLDGEIADSNTIGIGINYSSDYGTTLNLGTDLYFDGKLGNIINSNFNFGDYLGLDIGTYSYYGKSNKIGIFSRLGYQELPFFIYEGNEKIAKFLSREIFLNLGVYSQPNNKTMLSYGISSKMINFNLDTGDKHLKKLEYSGNINKTYLMAKYNTLDSISVPMKGIKIDFIYNLSNSFGNLKTGVYGPSYSLRGYYPISKKMSLLYGIDSAIIRGNNIKTNQLIKLGGPYTNIEKNEFEFYGFNFHEKSIKEFLNLSIGLRYKLFYSTYLTTKFNTATFGNETKRENIKLIKNFSKGLGISIIYDSPLGPVEFLVSKNTKLNKPIATFSIGYRLD